jgi:hypothetical protein
MNIGKAIYGILSGTTAVTDIVGTKIFPEIAEQETAVPFVIYQVQSVQPEDTHDGPSKLDEVRVEVLCYDDAYNGAADLASAVRGALDRVRGTYNGVNVESVQFNDVDFEIEYDPRRYSQVLTFTFRIKRDDIEIALGTPITGAQLGDLSDVNVTGVTGNQILSYDADSETWVPAADAGGAEVLNDLTDVDASQPVDNQMLAYQQGEWTTIYQDEIVLPIASVTGLQAALDAAPDNLRELTDVTISTPATGDYLYYNGADWINQSLIVGRNGVEYTGNYDSEAETLLDGATETVELYYTAQADGDGLHEDAQSDTPTSGYDIRRKLYYAEKAQADPDTSGDWTQFTAIADNTTFANAKAALLAYLKERTGGTVPISLKMTWEEVAQAPAFTGLLNESYGSGAEAAYSTRRLNGNVTDCMVIRRASDSTTQTIGFDGSGNIDESAIETFCTGTTCTVVTWKDQSGNGNDATQSDPTKQPTIYTGGALVKEGGKVALDFDGSDDGLTLSSLTYSNDLSLISLYNQTSGTNGRIWCDDITGQQGYWILFGVDSRNNQKTQINDGSGFNTWTHQTAPINQQNLLNIFFTSSQIVDSLNGTAQTQSVTGFSPPINLSGSSAGFAIGNSGNLTTPTAMKGQEFILYNSDKSSVRTSIESNIGDYFTQNTPLLDTYSGAAAAYSLRLLDSTYTGALVEVYNGSSYADIGANVFGELDTVALAAHCGSNDGFVSVWYDQSGNSNDAAQTTTANMPKIYDGTTGVVTEGTKPAMTFDLADNFSTGVEVNLRAFFHVGKATAATRLRFVGSNLEWVRWWSATDLKLQNNADMTLTGQDRLAYNLVFAANDTTSQLAVNGGTATTATGLETDSMELNISLSDSSSWQGTMQEIIIYESDQSSNRANIEDNINTFYNIY